MASEITVMNFTENQQYVYITISGGTVVVSGYLKAGATSGFQVPNPDQLYNVYFEPQGTSGYLTASNVAPNSQVGISISAGDADS
jgi:hypothetical protein